MTVDPGTGVVGSDEVAGRTGDDRSIGRMLLDAGKIRPQDAERALALQAEQGIRFGEACVRLGLVSDADIGRVLASQFAYPYLAEGDSALGPELVAATCPFSDQVEGLRAIRTQLLLRWFRSDRKMLSLVSPSAGDGRTYLAANLAIVFSQLGERTLLIDGDLRGGRQHSIFRVANRHGLSALLAGRSGGAGIEAVRHFANLSVLPSGAPPPNPLELLSRPEFRSLLAAEVREFDVILIDTPAADRYSDAQAIAAHAGGALVLGKSGRSRLRDLDRLVASIRGASAEVVGTVLNRFQD